MPLPLPRSIGIDSISVEGLFGKYNFPDIRFARRGASRIGLLYGQNGCGKTTILGLIFHILSPHAGKRHRSTIAKIAFKSVSIKLTNNVVVTVARDSAIVGGFRYEITGGKTPISVPVIVNDRLAAASELNPSLHLVEALLAGLSLDIVFLTADRLLLTTQAVDPDPATFRVAQGRSDLGGINVATSRRFYGGGAETEISSEEIYTRIQQANLDRMIDAALDLLRREAFSARATGDERAADVYFRILDFMGQSGEDGSDEDYANLLEMSARLAERSKGFQNYGLITDFRLEQLRTRLKQVPTSGRAVAFGIIKPYLDSISRRLDALDPARELASTLAQSLNDFLVQKSANVNVRKGIVISDDQTGEQLRPIELSSGERQLLFLFATSLLARDKSTIILIDEPELSLNPAWQRKLMQSVLDLAANAPVQILAATHSIEIITQHRENVAELVI